MPTQLTNLKVNEVSLVDEPANPGAHVLLFKNKGETVGKLPLAPLPEFKKALVVELAKLDLWGVTTDDAKTYEQLRSSAEVSEMIDVLAQSLRSIIADSETPADQRVSMVSQSLSEFQQAVAGVDLTSGQEDTQTQEPATEPTQTPTTPEEEVTMTTTQPKQPVAEPTTKAVEPVLDDAVNKAIAPLQKQLADQAAIIKSFQDKEAHQVALSKARELSVGLVTDEEKLAGIVKALSPEQVTHLGEILKAAAEQAKLASVLEKRGSLTVIAGGAVEQAKNLASDIRKANPSLTEQQALTKAYEINPGLYEKVAAEEKAARTA